MSARSVLPIDAQPTDADLRSLQQAHDRLNVKLDTMTAEMDREILAIKAKYKSPMDELKAKIDHHEKMLKALAEANPHWFEKRRSVVNTWGEIGYRKTTPKVTLLRKLKVDRVIALIAAQAPAWFSRTALRKRLELNKEAIIECHTGGTVTDEQLAKYGLKVSQRETFYVKPNLESVKR